MEAAIQLGNIESEEDKADYFIKEVVGVKPSLFHMDDKKSLVSTFYYLISNNKEVSDPCNIKTKTLNLKLLENLLEMRVATFVELVNAKVKNDSFNNYQLVAACFFREDFEKPYSSSELIKIAEELSEQSLEVALWGAKLYQNLITLLKETFPILYEGSVGEQTEGRRAYDMLNSLAKDDPTKWEEAENLTLHKAFLWLEVKAIEADRKKQRG